MGLRTGILMHVNSLVRALLQNTLSTTATGLVPTLADQDQ